MANELDAGADDGQHIMTLPEVPDDGVLIKTLYAGVCHATHSSRRSWIWRVLSVSRALVLSEFLADRTAHSE